MLTDLILRERVFIGRGRVYLPVWILWLASLCAFCPSSEARADQTAVTRGLLFEVHSARASEPSFLFGTIHSEDPRVQTPPDPIQAAFDASPRFALEVVPDGPALIRAMMAMTYTDGRTLRDVLPLALYDEVKQALDARGMSEEAFKDFKPWAIMTQLSTPPAVTGDFLDMRLYRSAVSGHKRIEGLETMDEQLAIFDTLSIADQIAMLRETLASRERLTTMFEQLLQAYLQRDLVSLQALSDAYLRNGDPRLADLFRQIVIEARNRRMAQRMAPLLDEGGWFIAVGALHLAGERGLVSLLRQRGYSLVARY